MAERCDSCGERTATLPECADCRDVTLREIRVRVERDPVLPSGSSRWLLAEVDRLRAEVVEARAERDGLVADLQAAADVLGRAADFIEQLAAAASDGDAPQAWTAEGGSVVWERPTGFPDGHDVVRVANDCTGSEAEHIAAFDPRTVAALVPVLRPAAGAAQSAADAPGPLADWVAALLVFARRVLREEEETGG